MDPFTLVVGFVVGAFTGAAGHYLGAKYTDKRRIKESSSNRQAQWDEVKNRFPAIIAEMMEDAKHPELQGVREFFVKSSRTSVNRDEPCFEYHTDVHEDIGPAVSYLEELGYIEDVTPGNCPMYRMKEHFIDLLRQR
ncbi:hypothetical protein [Zhongshania marina]|uniref:Uncharacterized protein n=1 Tax=Zhongshania marina TaxID=2304603 RepID=A0A2S4HC07_9GAMM|nr:hypothetical protein [Marortus luteolus]POP51536.1 hypothetical protein C0068_16500 [Marortus luteolus]